MYYINDFLEYLKKQGYNTKTIDNYKTLFKKLNKFLLDKKITEIKSFTEKIINDFFKTITDFKKVKVTTALQMNRLGIYFEYLEDTQKIFISPMRNFVTPKFYRTHYPTLTQDEMEKILESIDSDDPYHIKARAIMELMYSSALRPREVYSLKLSDINFNEGILFIEQSKGQKDRIVPVGKTALFWLFKYIKEIRPQFIKIKIMTMFLYSSVVGSR